MLLPPSFFTAKGSILRLLLLCPKLCSSYRRLDIRELQRKGFLRPGGWTSLSWSRNGESVGSVGIRAEFDRVVLRYRHQSYGEDWKSIQSFWTARRAT